MTILKNFIIENSSLLSEGFIWHLEGEIPISECVFRWGSDAHVDLMSEARTLLESGFLEKNILHKKDIWILENTDIGRWGLFEGSIVPLDLPFEESLEEAKYHGKTVELNKPQRGGDAKKFSVYVKNDKGNVIKLGFGQPGMRIKTHSPERVRSFLARHNCDNPGPRWKARWWSCNLHRYKKQLGLNFKGRW